MSTSATVPVFAPDGTLGDIPQDQLAAAVRKGFKPGVHVAAPDGTPGVIPANRTQEAVQKGIKVIPLGDQPAKSFWGEAGKAIWSDISGAASGAYKSMTNDPLADPRVSDVEKSQLVAQQEADAAAKIQQRRKNQPYPGYADVAAPAAEMLGANVSGMEDAAKQGNPGAVMGHAVAAAAPYVAGEALSQGGPMVKDAFPSIARAGEKFQAISKVAGQHTVQVTPELSNSLMEYQQLVDAGGSRSLATSKLLNRLTSPSQGPLTYDEARLFQSNLSRLSADEAQRLTPVMRRQVGKITSALNDAVENTAAGAGKLEDFQSAMQEYAAAKTNEARLEVLKKWGLKASAAAALGGAGVAGVKLMKDLQ